MKNNEKMKNNSELRALSINELNDLLLDVRRQQFNVRLVKAVDSLKSTHVVKLMRRQVARIKTIMTEKLGAAHVE